MLYNENLANTQKNGSKQNDTLPVQNFSGQEKVLKLPEQEKKSDILKIIHKLSLDFVETEQCLKNFYGKVFTFFRGNVF